jgi:hypothetical protein
MRRSILSVLLALAVLFFVSVPGDAQAGGRGGWHGGGGRGGHGGGGYGRGGYGRGWHGGGGYGHGYKSYYGGYGRGYYGYGYPRVVVGVGLPAFGWGWPYYGYGYGWYGPPAYTYAPPAPVYVQRPAAAEYWYYCESEEGYYPDVPDCPEEWVPVPPAPERRCTQSCVALSES